MKHDIIPTKAERREAKHKPKMAVNGRNTKRLAQNLARAAHIDPAPSGHHKK
jgi:hypothetical protein